MSTFAGDRLRPQAETFLALSSKHKRKHDLVHEVVSSMQKEDGRGRAERATTHHCGSCVHATFILDARNPELRCPIRRHPAEMMKDIELGEISNCSDYFPQRKSEYAQGYANFLSLLGFKKDEYLHLFDSLVSANVSMEGVMNDLASMNMLSSGERVFYSANRFGGDDDSSDFILKTEQNPKLIVGNELIGRLLPAKTFFMNPWCFDEGQLSDLDFKDSAQRDYLTALKIIYLQLSPNDRIKTMESSWLALP